MKHECYDRCYQIMCISDTIKERGYDFDCYEDLWEQSNEIYNEWEEWDIANDTDKLSWLGSLNKFLDNKEEQERYRRILQRGRKYIEEYCKEEENEESS